MTELTWQWTMVHPIKKKRTASEKWNCQQCGVSGIENKLQRRRGPNGKNTFCNACGLRWAREQYQHAIRVAARMDIQSLLNPLV